jgi:protein TonB
VEENMKWEQGQLTIEGTVFVSFIVDSIGNIENVRVTKSLCESCDVGAIRIVKSMPNWVPAKGGRRRVSSKAVVPIPFKLS